MLPFFIDMSKVSNQAQIYHSISRMPSGFIQNFALMIYAREGSESLNLVCLLEPVEEHLFIVTCVASADVIHPSCNIHESISFKCRLNSFNGLLQSTTDPKKIK